MVGSVDVWLVTFSIMKRKFLRQTCNIHDEIVKTRLKELVLNRRSFRPFVKLWVRTQVDFGHLNNNFTFPFSPIISFVRQRLCVL